MNILKSKSTRYATSAVLVSSLFAACGGGGGGGGGSPPAPPPPSPPAPAVTLVSSTPTVRTGVPTASAITMTFSGALDVSTVTAANVRVSGGGVTTPVSVLWDVASLTLTIRPQQPLSTGVLYTVSIPGVRDVGGNAIANSTLTFKTFISANPQTATFTNGVQTGLQLGKLDSQDNLVQVTTFNGAGPNGTWGDADDLAASYQTIEYDTAGNAARFVNWSAGPDQKANTPDDSITSFTARTYDSLGNITQLINYDTSKGGLGADGKPFTPDDLPTTFTAYTYNANGYATKIQNYTGPGGDGKAFSPDDLVGTSTERTYDAGNGLLTEVNYASPGVPTTFQRRTYDRVGGSELKRESFKNSGPDNIPFNGNDVIEFIAIQSYDGNGNPTQIVFYTEPGTDGNWDVVGDNKIGGHICFTYGTFGLTRQEAFTGGYGTDGKACSADDYPSYFYYTEQTFDPSGNLLQRTTFNGPGADGKWRDGNDQIGEAGNFFGF